MMSGALALYFLAVCTFEYPQGLISLETGEFVAPLPSCSPNDLGADSGYLRLQGGGSIPCARRFKI